MLIAAAVVVEVNLFIDSPFITKMKLIGLRGVRDESGISIDFRKEYSAAHLNLQKGFIDLQNKELWQWAFEQIGTFKGFLAEFDEDNKRTIDD